MRYLGQDAARQDPAGGPGTLTLTLTSFLTLLSLTLTLTLGKIRLAGRGCRDAGDKARRVTGGQYPPQHQPQQEGQDQAQGQGQGGLIDKAWVRTNEAKLALFAREFPGTALDVGSSSGEVVVARPKAHTAHLGKERDPNPNPHLGKERENFRALPSSLQRKRRRMLTALCVFDLASGGRETLSAGELHEYTMRERERLLRLLGLVQEGEMAFPRVPRACHDALFEPFCITRAVLCCHLAVASEQLRSLREEEPSAQVGP